MAVDPYTTPEAAVADPTSSVRSTPLVLTILKLALLPVFALAIVSAFSAIVPLVMDIVIFSSIRPVRLTGLLISAVVSAALVALAFCFPLAIVYKNRRVLAAIVVCIPEIFVIGENFIGSGRFFVVATNALSIISIAVLVPYLAHRVRFGTST